MEKNLKFFIKELGLECKAGEELLNRVPKGAYVSDLLSDVIGKAQEDMIWITTQAHRNIIAVASLKELSAIIVVNDRKVDDDVLESADSEGVVVLSTKEAAFETAGKLYCILYDIDT
ncbi:MAG: DRTGG domain-containing protein [Fermentimonas sp.]|nr:DRTGG domain-containing protein [Fermentimonas sp.]